ncbi:hypothetical protein HD554DRAFT_1047352 [Boletus coccyginus]|nr:hypothetical protein HD554DRAFT_1434315 [Boletus coccyginus]KAI9567043.1 hypothetical protein HD554DRAFT_1047352 [Boletus coccyginus]
MPLNLGERIHTTLWMLAGCVDIRSLGPLFIPKAFVTFIRESRSNAAPIRVRSLISIRRTRRVDDAGSGTRASHVGHHRPFFLVYIRAICKHAHLFSGSVGNTVAHVFMDSMASQRITRPANCGGCVAARRSVSRNARVQVRPWVSPSVESVASPWTPMTITRCGVELQGIVYCPWASGLTPDKLLNIVQLAHSNVGYRANDNNHTTRGEERLAMSHRLRNQCAGRAGSDPRRVPGRICPCIRSTIHIGLAFEEAIWEHSSTRNVMVSHDSKKGYMIN